MPCLLIIHFIQLYMDCAGAAGEEAKQAGPLPASDVEYTSPGDQKSVWMTMIRGDGNCLTCMWDA